MRLVLLSALLLAACAKKADPVDEVPPPGVLTLDTPGQAAWVAAGEIQAGGEAANVTDVTLGGVAGSQSADGTWSLPLTLDRGITALEARAVDLRGDDLYVRHAVIAGDFADPDGPVDDALLVRLNRGGIAKVCDLAEGLVTTDLVNGALPAVNPVMVDSFAGIDMVADVDSVYFGAPDIRIDPAPGHVTLTAVLPDLDVDLTINADAWGIYEDDFGLGMTASEAVITADVIIAAHDGQIGVTLANSSVELRDFAYSLSFLPSWITDYAFVDTIRGTVEDMLVDQITTMVPPLLDDTLAGLDPSFSTELFGRTVGLAFGFAHAESDSDGLLLSLDLDVDFPSSGDHTYAGFLAAPAGVPTIGRNADVSAAISDDLLNLVLFEAWRSGILELTLSTDDGSLEPALLYQLKTERGTIDTFAALPPVIVERDGGLLAQVGELLVTIDTPGGELGEHMVVAIAGEVPLEVAISGGELVLDLGTPTLTMMVRESDWGASEGTVTALLEQALPLEALLSLLGELSFPLPTLYGIGFDAGTAARDADGVHTNADIFLQ